MIRNDAKYQNGKIYKITDLTNGSIYIGSTIQSLSQRLGNHVRTYKAWLKCKSNYTTSFEIIKNSRYEITLLEAFPCNNKHELEARELKHIMATKCINRYKPAGIYINGGKKEYYKQWISENKEAVKAYKSQYYNDNKDDIKLYMVKYNEKNKEALKAKWAEYREKNKDTILATKRQKYNCNCGGQYTYSVKARHLKTIKHRLWLMEQWQLQWNALNHL